MCRCSGAQGTAVGKGLMPEANTGVDSVNLQIRELFDFEFLCQVVLTDILE